jgi:hypothetical protein
MFFKALLGTFVMNICGISQLQFELMVFQSLFLFQSGPLFIGLLGVKSQRNAKLETMASFFGTYIDDIRGGGSTEAACRQTIHRTASHINYLGQQDAPRKRGQATQHPRAWAGSKCLAIEGQGLYVLSMDEK